MTPVTIAQAESAHRAGDLEAARDMYTLALAANRDDVDALYGLGTIELQQSRVEQALALFKHAAELQPQAADICLNHAVCLMEAERRQESIEEAKRAASLAWNDEAFLVIIGNLLTRLGEPALVISLFKNSVQPGADARILLAKSHGMLGEWDRAVALLRALHQEQSDNASVANDLAVAAGKLRDYTLAISSYQHYMKLVTPTAVDHLRFADLLLIAREIDDSERELAQADSLAADSAEYHVLRARLARLRGATAEALSAAITAIEIEPDNGQAWSIRVEITDKDKLPDLISRLQSLLESEVAKPYFRILLSYALANACMRSGDSARAFTELRTANQLQNKSFSERGLAYDIDGKEEEAESIIRYFSQVYVTAPPADDQPTPIFIVGMPRSGTTLMEKLLAQLDIVTATGENETMGFLGTQYQLDANRRLIALPADMSASDWAELRTKYFARNRSSNYYITDKMPHNFMHVGLILSMFPQARVLQMRRDPRDVCLSIYSRSFPDGHPYACSFDSLAHASMLCQKLMDHWVRLNPARVMDVQYEQLVSDTRGVGQQVFEFCGLEWSDSCLEFHRDTTPSFTFSEMQVRKAISTSSVNRWREYDEYLGELYTALRRWDWVAP